MEDKKIIILGGEKYEVVFTKEEIKKGIVKVAKAIKRDFKKWRNEEKPPILLVLANGGIPFGKDLLQELEEMNFYPEFHVMLVSRYKEDDNPNEEASFVLEKIYRGRRVIIVDDLIDEGKTIFSVYNELKKQKPKSIKIAVLITKTDKKIVPLKVHYCAFKRIGLGWLVGFGMDEKGLYRGLKYIVQKILNWKNHGRKY